MQSLKLAFSQFLSLYSEQTNEIIKNLDVSTAPSTVAASWNDNGPERHVTAKAYKLVMWLGRWNFCLKTSLTLILTLRPSWRLPWLFLTHLKAFVCQYFVTVRNYSCTVDRAIIDTSFEFFILPPLLQPPLSVELNFNDNQPFPEPHPNSLSQDCCSRSPSRIHKRTEAILSCNIWPCP